MVTLLVLLGLVAAAGVPYILWTRLDERKQRRAKAIHDDALTLGDELVPVSIHPDVDLDECIGSGACVRACPEHDILAITDGRARLINPLSCIGHSACMQACPVGAIKLVFGTATRGVELPKLSSSFETTQPGIYVVGELGGMGLIRNAIEQGRQAMESVAKKLGKPGRGIDVAIVGAGPSGIAATLAAKERGFTYLTIEQDSLGGTVASFPRRKLVMTAPAQLPIVGKVKFTETTKEALLGFWQKVERDTGIEINYGERLEKVSRNGATFVIETTKGKYAARALLLAIGRRGTPRKLGVPGEELPKVTYRLLDPEQYRDLRVLVVGGGDSAIESAVTIADQPGATVTLSYRSAAFGRAKRKNRERLDAGASSGRIQILLESNVKAIGADFVDVDQKGKMLRLPNDAVIVNAGGILATQFLKEIGIEVETKYGTR